MYCLYKLYHHQILFQAYYIQFYNLYVLCVFFVWNECVFFVWYNAFFLYGIRVLRADKQRVCEGPKHILNIYKYNKTGSILKIEPYFCVFSPYFCTLLTVNLYTTIYKLLLNSYFFIIRFFYFLRKFQNQ